MLHINLKSDDRVLEIPIDKLPDDPSQILKIFAKEKVPIKQWLSLAVSNYLILKAYLFF